MDQGLCDTVGLSDKEESLCPQETVNKSVRKQLVCEEWVEKDNDEENRFSKNSKASSS